MLPFIIAEINNHIFININTFIMKLSFYYKNFDEIISEYFCFYINVSDMKRTHKYKQYTPFQIDYLNNKTIIYLLIRIDNPYGLSKLLSELKINDKILISKPQNDFRIFKPLLNNLICLAGGTGIAVFIQLFNQILNNPNKTLPYKNIYLIVANRSKENILLPNYLNKISYKMNKFINFYYINLFDTPYEFAINEPFLINFLNNKKNKYSIRCVGRDKFCDRIKIILKNNGIKLL